MVNSLPQMQNTWTSSPGGDFAPSRARPRNAQSRSAQGRWPGVGREETLIHKIWEMIVMLANGVGDKLIEAGPIWLWSAGRRFPINPDTPWSLMGSQRVPGVLVMIVSIDPTDLMRKLMLGRRLGQTGSLITERMRITHENLFPRRYFFLGNVFYLLESHCGRVDLPPLPLVHAWVLRIRSCWLGLWNFHNHYLFLILMIKTAQKGCSIIKKFPEKLSGLSVKGGGYPPFPLRKKTFFFSHRFSVKGVGGGVPP